MWFDEFDYPCLEDLARVKVFGVDKAANALSNYLATRTHIFLISLNQPYVRHHFLKADTYNTGSC